jgi:hypothetical protein
MWKGYLLLLVSITAEAFFGDSQAYIKITYKPTINQLMASVNMVTFLFCFTRMIISNELGDALKFCL